MPIKVFYHVKARQDFYDLIRSTMPADRYELLVMEGDSQEERLAKLAEAEMVIVGGLRLSEAEIEAAGRLRLVLHQGVGYHDTVATDALMKRQIRLAVTPQGTSEGVAEHAIMMMLATGRRLAYCDAELREGRWHSNTFRSTARQLLGATVGIIGLGRIGKQVAKRLIGFGTRTIYTDLLEMAPEIERDLQVTRATFDEILTHSDFITLHVPLTDSTHHMIDTAAIARMRPGTTLINCARGPVASQEALLEGLRSGHLGGVGLDVFEIEPLPAPNPFAEFPNVVLTPHHAPGTRDTMVIKFSEIFANADRFFSGDRMENEISLSR
jgi:phosphoglycerate dehydrogenase-like enzyme